MSVIEIGTSKSGPSFKVGGGSSAKGGVSISDFNNQLRDGAKKGEKVDFKTLEQVSDIEVKRLDTKALKKYVEKHKEDKPHIQEIFGSASPLAAIYNDNDSFRSKDSWLSGLIGKLLKFIADPSLESFKGIAKGLVTEDGTRINLRDNKLLSELDKDSKLSPLAAALRIVGTTEQNSQAQDELKENPEAGVSHDKETINAIASQSLARLRHIFDDEGNILNSNGDVLYGPLEITPDDIAALKADDENTLTVSEGSLKWNDFASKVFKLYASDQAGQAIDYANTVFAIFNKKMRARVEDTSLDKVEREGARATNREVINTFKERLSREFGGEYFAKAFDLAFTSGAFMSETARNAIVGKAAEKATKAAISKASSDLKETAGSKGNSLKELTKGDDGIDLQALTDGDKYTIVDLGKVCNSAKAEIINGQPLDYNGNKLTLATAADAYKKSAEILGQTTAKEMAKEVLDTNLGDTEARDKYLANAKTTNVKGINDEAANIAKVADTKAKTVDDVLAEVQKSIDGIKKDGFLVPTAGDLEASDKFAKKLTKKLITIAGITEKKSNRDQVEDLRKEISKQAMYGNFKLDKLLKKTIEIDPSSEDNIKDRFKMYFKTEANAKTFVTDFINNEEMVSLANVVKQETIQELVKSPAISELILRQPENRALSVSSLDEIIDDPQKLADASPELALIWADPEVYKDDSKRAEMAMLGLMSLLKSNPTLLNPGSASAKNIAKKLFSKEVKNDDNVANRIADKFKTFIQSGKIKPDGITDDLGFQEASKLAGTSISRAKYLDFMAPQVAYAKEAVTADRLARMINAHTPYGSRSNVHSAIEALAEHLESAAEKLDGADFKDIRSTVTEGLNDSLSQSIVKNMFFPGDDGDSTGTSSDKLTGNSAVQSVLDAAMRMRMIIPRLYRGSDSNSTSSTNSKTKEKVTPQESSEVEQNKVAA